MKKIFSTVIFLTTFLYVNVLFAGNISDNVEVSVDVMEQPNANWGISVRDADYDYDGADMSVIDTSVVQMYAMGHRKLVLGKLYLKLDVYDLYEVVVYTNSMDINNDGTPDIPWNWDQKPIMVKQDFIDRHAGLQNQNPYYLDNDGFNSLLYGAALKIRSEGIHGYATSDGPIPYDNNNDYMPDAETMLQVNDTVPDSLWASDQAQFTYIPELAIETILGQQLVKVAGSIYQSRLVSYNGDPNWLEMILATSEENVGSDRYYTNIYFDLRWN